MPAEIRDRLLVLLTANKRQSPVHDIVRLWQHDGYETRVMSPDWTMPADKIVTPVVKFVKASVESGLEVALIGTRREGFVAVSAGLQLAEVQPVQIAAVGMVFKDPDVPKGSPEAFLSRRLVEGEERGEVLDPRRFTTLIDRDIEDPDAQTLYCADKRFISDLHFVRMSPIFRALTGERHVLQEIFEEHVLNI